MTEQYKNEVKDLVDLCEQIKTANGANRQALIQIYLGKLEHLMDSGWRYALGKEHEIEERLLPQRYKVQRDSDLSPKT